MVDITKKQGFIGLLAVLVLSSGVTYLVVDDDFSGCDLTLSSTKFKGSVVVAILFTPMSIFF